MTDWPVYGKIDGPIVMIGFGSIGKGTLPLIERHFSYDKQRFVVIDPEDKDRKILDERGIRFIHQAVTRDNYRELLTPLLTAGGGQGFCVNLSVDTSSLDIMELCRELGALYIDTVNEPWAGFYFDTKKGPEARSNYALREATLAAKRKRAGRLADRGVAAAAPIPAWCPGSSSRRCSTSPPTSAPSSRSRRRARIGAGLPRSSASRASISPSATPSARSIPSRSTPSSIPGRSKASCRRVCSRPSSAAARMRSGCRTTAASTRPAVRPRSICCSRAPTRACAPGRRLRRGNTASWSRTTSRSRSRITSPA